jgi:hypothetical protein
MCACARREKNEESAKSSQPASSGGVFAEQGHQQEERVENR